MGELRARFEADSLEKSSFRADATQKLVALGEDAFFAWKRKRAGAKCSAMLAEAKAKRDELVKRRCSAMLDLSNQQKVSPQSHLNGRISRALVGGGPITKTANEWPNSHY